MPNLKQKKKEKQKKDKNFGSYSQEDGNGLFLVFSLGFLGGNPPRSQERTLNSVGICWPFLNA
jgi:hypothetical protein